MSAPVPPTYGQGAGCPLVLGVAVVVLLAVVTVVSQVGTALGWW